ncbi:MAG TPA: TonB-dependent receptor [Allosphingosinicella sp.]|nr:TonB-dependent receptor [Allosphingosinicella sp.]
MRKNQFLSNLLATTFICGAASFATPAFAQDDQPAAGAAQEDQGQEVVITGSRIPAPNLTAVSPVTVVNSQDIRLQGVTRTEDLINSLPQAFAGQGGNLANGATGTATVDLRGLGANRTLVLINGRRLVPGDPTFPTPDINVIPSSIVNRVDVLTGGASSVYGSDAVSGVVNFVMDTDLEGVRLDAQYSFYQHNNRNGTGIADALNARGFGFPTGNVADGGTFDVSLAIGAGFDDGRGHVVAYAGYRKLEAVTQGRRDYSSCATQARTPAQAGTTPPGGFPGAPLFFCGGSATSANGTVFAWDGGTSTTLQIGPNRTLIGGTTPYNFAPTNYFQRPDERYVMGAFARYEISPALQPYLEVMFMNDRTLAQIAPSGNFGNTFTINCGAPGSPTAVSPGVGNPLLSAQQRGILCDTENLIDTTGQAVGAAGGSDTVAVFTDPATGLQYTRGQAQILRRNVEGGGRISDLEHTNYRIVTGIRGDLSDVWSYDVYYQFAQTNFALTYQNDFSVTRLGRALDVIDDPDTAGVDPVCRTQNDGTDGACVPWDIWATGQVNPASLAYLQTPGFQRGNVQQTVASASLTGNLGEWGVQLPWANSGVGLALGVEYRKESLELMTDVAFQTLPSSDLAGQGAPTLPVSGSFDVREAFAEIRIPIIEDSFIYNFSIEAGYRYSDYGIGARSVSTDTYKIGVDFSPIRDVRFRGAYNRAVRAPNIQELFAPQRVALNGNGDPCAGNTPQASLAACQAMGVSAAQYGTIAGNPAGQYNGLIGGNPNLEPEIADTWTVGVVLQPSFIPRLAITVDWFDIKIDAPIQPIGQDVILATCAQSLDPFFCGLVQRDQFGTIWRTGTGFVRDLNQNIGEFSTRGIDVGISYSMDWEGVGGFSFNMNGTWLDKLVTDNGVSEPYDCAGYYGPICGIPNPEWRHRARLSYSHASGLGLSVQWRYFASVDVENSSANTTLNQAFAPFNARIPSQSYFDLTLTARIGDHYNFRLGVNNIFDREPPIIGANGTNTIINACAAVVCSGNTFPNVYDAMGRYIFAGITLDF